MQFWIITLLKNNEHINDKILSVTVKHRVHVEFIPLW